MEITFNLDEPLENQPGSGAPKPPEMPPEPEPREPAPPSRRLRLPLIGNRPVSFQMQVLATAFIVLLILAGYVGIRDGRMAAYRAVHLSMAGEIGILTERLAMLAPRAQESAEVLAALAATRQRESKLLTLLDSGGEWNDRVIPAADDSLHAALEEVHACWPRFDGAISGLTVPAAPAAVEQLKAANAAYGPLRDAVARLHQAAGDALKQGDRDRAIIAALGSLAMLMLVLFFKIFDDDSKARQALLEQQRREAEEANAKTQAAISQLMEEMTNVADGDLTARASVGDHITGTIADAMNYAVEELGVLVKRINDASHRVATASSVAAKTSVELLDATEVQSTEIRHASGQVLSMAQSMNEVSGKAEQSARVARRSLDAATKGASAVADSISGMDGIRGQIQETSKRIKRLGESSQEIGEIVELITDITEQTNVLALNAAIQAASAGEAGRGFTVVAEEVQRLAERSADATRRIAALVKTIQADTQGAVSAMENSTQGVIEGARLSDAAGGALADISTVSRQLAELIEGISADTRQQADVAKQVAQAMREILRITEQTSRGTSSTAISINELADLAVELKGSVAGFKV